ncbi:hypothetical protein CEE37_02485 [candidate division LCP-89 bacterium B3_LCP]|uniref:RadC-like JAB domain-containing protein n=1 Tax=candidate division LCP-89 bacterium B3_LCP TaxID=2012998 RepID=A0A532V5U5_UNCL8|nr:MAG: hypothetical protein CEE37_02485 [candidate division LCP-89 bacterium B3_LCP]
MLSYFHKIDRESVIVLFLNQGNKCVHTEVRFGDNTSVNFPTDSIIDIAETKDSTKIFLAHNHPGDRATPSDYDVQHAAALYLSLPTDFQLVDDLVWCRGKVKSVMNTHRFKQMVRMY